MPPRKKIATRKTATKKAAARKAAATRRPAAAKKAARGRAKTRALAIADAVMHEDPRRSLFDSQFAVIEAILAWAPARILANQHAAFWEGFAGNAGTELAQHKPARKRPKRR